MHRGGLVLVMGDGEEDLLKWWTAVTAALQTTSWLKSFVDVGLEELEGLNEIWFD